MTREIPNILLVVAIATSVADAEDWPMFGRDATHNAVSPEKNAPIDWDVGEFDRRTGRWIKDTARNIKWTAQLGSQTNGDPVVAEGFVWIGTNNYWGRSNEPKLDASVLACFRESDGELLYRYVSPRLPRGRIHDWPTSSMACSPLVEGDRVWFATNRAETVCLDIGPLKRGDGEPRIVWKLDMMKRLGVFPTCLFEATGRASSVASYKDRIYVNTNNGVDQSELNLPAPEAPSLL